MKKLLLTLAFTGLILPVVAAVPLQSHERRAIGRLAQPSSTTVVVKQHADNARPYGDKRAVALSSTLITEAPAGDVREYTRAGYGSYSAGFWAEFGDDCGYATHAVWCDDGSVYIKNPLLFHSTGSYMKGHVEGDEIVFDLPQLIELGSEDPDDPEAEVMEFYLTKLIGVLDEDYGEIEMTPVEGPCQIRYKINGDSFGRELDEDEFTMLGLVWDGMFMDYGELSCEYTPFSAAVVDAPAGLATEEWVCTYGGDGHYVNVGFSGNEAFIQGIAPGLPDSWIKGSVVDGKVTFDSGQFLGTDPGNNHIAYFYGATMSLEEDPDWGDMVMTPHLSDVLVFDFDSDAKIMSTDDAALINASTSVVYYMNLLDKTLIRTAPADGMHIPANPVILNFMPAAILGTGALQFDLPRVSTDGDILSTEKMFYNVYFDGVPATLVDGMPDIPWNYSDGWDFSVYGITHEAYYYDQNVAKVGIQNCYDDNGEVKRSAIVYTDGSVVGAENGVNDAINRSEVVSERYTDLLGRPVAMPASGIFMRISTHADGSRSVSKVAVR